MSIQSIEDALAANDLGTALALTLKTWATSRDAVLADVVDSLGRKASFEPPVERTNAGFQKKWLEVARKDDPIAVTWLADTLATRMSAGEPDEPFKARLAAIRKASPDPRFALALTKLVEERTSLSRWCDTEILKTLRLVGDLRARSALKAFGDSSGTKWSSALDELKVKPLAAAEAERFQKLLPSTPKKKTLKLGRDDDASRAVLADALQLENDPRGEFIALQIAEAEGRGTPETVKRADALLAKHKKEWLGGLVAVTVRARFTRGFVSDLTLAPTWKAKEPAWKKYADDPVLETVETIDGKTTSPIQALFVKSSATKQLRTLVIDDKVICAAAHERAPDSIKEIVSTGWGKKASEVYAAEILPLIERFPNLEQMTVTLNQLNALMKAKGFDRLSSLLMAREDDEVIDPFAVFAKVPAHIKTVRVGEFWRDTPVHKFLHGARDFVDVHRQKNGFSVAVKLINGGYLLDDDFPALVKAAGRQKDVRSFVVRVTDKTLLDRVKQIALPLAKKGVKLDVAELPPRSGLAIGLTR